MLLLVRLELRTLLFDLSRSRIRDNPVSCLTGLNWRSFLWQLHRSKSKLIVAVVGAGNLLGLSVSDGTILQLGTIMNSGNVQIHIVALSDKSAVLNLAIVPV